MREGIPPKKILLSEPCDVRAKSQCISRRDPFFDPVLEKTQPTRDIDANKINEVKFSNGGRMIIRRIKTFSLG